MAELLAFSYAKSRQLVAAQDAQRQARDADAKPRKRKSAEEGTFHLKTLLKHMKKYG